LNNRIKGLVDALCNHGIIEVLSLSNNSVDLPVMMSISNLLLFGKLKELSLSGCHLGALPSTIFVSFIHFNLF